MSRNQESIRNVAIVAHVDHGKTTLVDQLFKQSGMFRENEVISERIMDSMDLEKERGITIASKNGACRYGDFLINIIDTPGHADFGGEVERVLRMADGVIFLVDAAEGPMPQSQFVLKKSLKQNLPIIILVNKIDKANARIDWVVDRVYDLLLSLDADESCLDFPVLYASARDGFASNNQDGPHKDMTDLFDAIVKTVPAPSGDPDGPVQMLISSISYSNFLGRLGIGKLTSGGLKLNQPVVVAVEDKIIEEGRVTNIFHYERNNQVMVGSAVCGDIVAVSGFSSLRVGQTLTEKDNPMPLPSIPIDPPTMSMVFLPNDSPFSGREGEFVTGNHLKERLERELLTDVALGMDPVEGKGFKVSGRGELHLAILIEKMRREGYEFQVSPPTVILKEIDGKKHEPYELLVIDVMNDLMGGVMESLGKRKGQLLDMIQNGNDVRLEFEIPTRGLLGYLSEFMTQTKGMGTMNSTFLKYAPYSGEIQSRNRGVLISNATAETVAYALFNLQSRGVLFLGPGESVYEGQIIGENAREEDMVVNPAKGKKLTNMRASGSDENVVLTPPRKMSLETCLSYITKNELLEVTPKTIRLRKVMLKESDRKRDR